MADRKLQYVIELLPDTKQFEKIREKMKALDGGELIEFSPNEAKRLKSILQGVVDDIGDRAGTIGAKINEGLSKGLDKAKLQELLDVDTGKLKETMEIVEKLTDLITKHSKSDNWLKDGKGFLGGLTGSEKQLSALEKSLDGLQAKFGQLEGNFNTINTSLQSTIATISELETKVQSLQGVKPVIATPSFDFAKVDKDVEQLKRKLNDLNSKKVKPLAYDIDVKDEINEIAKVVTTANEEITQLMTKLKDTDESDVNEIKNLKTQLAEQYVIKANHYKKLNQIKREYGDLDSTKNALSKHGLTDFQARLNESKQTIEGLINDITKISSVSGQGTMAININVAVPTEEDIRKKINDEIAELNRRKDALHAVKLTIDDTLNSSGKDSVLEQSEKTITQSFEKIDQTVTEKTEKWKEKIINAFKVEKKEISIPFTAEASAATVYNELQKYFQDNEIDIRINKELLTQEIKDAIEKGGVSGASIGGGGGTVALDPKAMAMAVASGLQAFLTGDFTSLTGDDKPKPAETQKPKKSFYLDPENPYNQEMAKMFKEVMVYAQGDKDTNKQVRSFFEMKKLDDGKYVDVDEAAKGSTIQLLDILSQLVERYGSTLVNEFEEKIPKSNIFLNNFKGDLKELIKVNNFDQTSVDEHIKQQHRDELFADYVKQSQLQSGLNKIKRLSFSDPKELKLPDTADIDKLISHVEEAMGEEGLNNIVKQVEAQQKIVEEAKQHFSQDALDSITQQLKDKTSELNRAKPSGDAKQIATLTKEVEGLEAEQARQQANKQSLRLAESKLDALERKQVDAQRQFDNYKPVLNALETVKEARSLVTDANDENQKQQFLDAIKSFNNEVSGVYGQLTQYLKEFRWGVDIKGFKKEQLVDGSWDVNKLLKLIDGDLSKIDRVHMYKAPESMRKDVETQDRTDPLFRDTKVKEFRTVDVVEQEIAETERLLLEAENNKNEALILSQKSKIRALQAEKEKLTKTPQRWENNNTAEQNTQQAMVEAEKRVYESEVEKNKRKKESLENEINIRNEEIKAEEESIAKLSENGRKIAGARKRLHNRQDALREAEAEYQRVEAEQIAAEEEIFFARTNLTNIMSQDHSGRDETQKKINAYAEILKDPSKHLESLKGEIVRGELKGGIYEDDYRNAKHYKDMAKRNIKAAKKQQQRLDYRDNELKYEITTATNRGETDRLNELLKEQEDNQKKRREYEEKEKQALLEAQKYQAEMHDINRKRRQATKKDKADFMRDVKARIGQKKAEQEARMVEYGEDPRIAAEERVKQAELAAETVSKQTEVARKSLDKAQQEMDALNDDELVQQAKEMDDHKKNIQEMKNLNAKAQEDLKTTNENLKAAEESKPSFTKEVLEQQESEIDALMDEATKLEEKIQHEKEELQKVDEFIKQTRESEDYKKVEYISADIEGHFKKLEKSELQKKGVNFIDSIFEGNAKSFNIPSTGFAPNQQQKIETFVALNDIVESINSVLKQGKTEDTELNSVINELATTSPQWVKEFFAEAPKEGLLKWLEKSLSIAEGRRNIYKTSVESYKGDDSSTYEKNEFIENLLQGKAQLKDMPKTFFGEQDFDALSQYNDLAVLKDTIESIINQEDQEDGSLRYLIKHLSDRDHQLDLIDDYLRKNPNSTVKDLYRELVDKAGSSEDNEFFKEEQNLMRYIKSHPELANRDYFDATRDKVIPDILKRDMPDEEIFEWLETYRTEVEEKLKQLKPQVEGIKSGYLLDAKDLDADIEVNKETIAKDFKEYIASLFKAIDEKIKAIDSGTLSKEQEGLLTKEIADLFVAIENAATKYKTNLKEEILTEEQKTIISGKDEGDTRSTYSYNSRFKDPLMNDKQKLKDISENIKTSKEYSDLQIRQAELLRDIANTDGDTSKLEEELNGVNSALGKYQQILAMSDKYNLRTVLADDVKFSEQYRKSVTEIIDLKQKVLTDVAKGASRDELNESYATIDSKQQELDALVYNSLTSKQKRLIKDIKDGTKNGVSTDKLQSDLKMVNQELIDLEANKRMLDVTSLSGDLYRASVSAVEGYTEKVKALIKAEQDLAIARAAGEDTTELVKTRTKAKNALDKYIESQQRAQAVDEQLFSSKAKALKWLTDNEKTYQDAIEKRTTARSKKRTAEYQLDLIQSTDRYSTSGIYKKHQNEVKSRLTDEYIVSDQYKEDRKKGKAKALQDTFDYVEKIIRSMLEKAYKESGKSLDVDTVREEFENEVKNRTKKTKYLLEQSLGKKGAKIDPSKMSEAYALYSEGGWEGIRDNIDAEFKETSEYQALIKERQEIRKATLNREIEAIQRESEEVIAMISSVSEDAYKPLQDRMNKISHANLDQMMSNFMGVVSDPNKTRNREAMIKNLGSAARSAGATKDQRTELERELKTLGDAAIKDVWSWFDRFIPSIFPQGDELKNLARQSLIFDEETRAKSRINKMQGKFDNGKFYADANVEKGFNEEIDRLLQNHMANALKNFELEISDDKFLKEAGVSTEILEFFKKSMEQNVYDLVSNYASGLKVESGVVKDLEGHNIDIREEAERRLINEINNYEDIEAEANKDVADYELNRKRAMKVAGVGYGQVADAEVLREQAILQSQLTLEKERQQEITAEIARLEKEGDPDGQLGKLNGALDQSNETIRKLQMFVDNRDHLMDLQHQVLKDEKASETWDLDKQKLFYESKKAAAEADLESGNEKVQKSAQERLEKYTNILSGINDKLAQRDAEEREKNNPMNIIANKFASAIKNALGGNGGLNVDATGLATEATLAQILAAITGGRVVEGSAHSEVAATKNVDAEWKAIKAKATEVYKDTKSEDQKPKDQKKHVDNAIKDLITKIQDPNIDSKTKIALQVALKDALGDFISLNKGNKKLNYKTGQNGKDYLPYEEIDKYFGLETGSIKNLRLTNSQAKKRLGEQGAVVQTQPKNVVEVGDGGINTLAKDDTLQKIYDVLNRIKTEGIKKGVSGSSGKKEEAPKKTEAELIKERALKDKDAVLGIAGSSKLKSSYEGLVKKLTEATELSDIKKFAQKVSALGFNIMKDSANWDMKVAQSDKIFSVSDKFGAVDKKTGKSKLKDNMEKEARKYAKEEQSQYKFLNFDGKQLTYQLTNIQGEVRKVTMEWSELNNQVAITSDKSVHKMDDLAGKIETFGDQFKDAIASGYLDKTDKDLKRFEEQVEAIQKKIESGASFGAVESERNRTLRVADEVAKKVAKNKRLYAGTTEIRAVEKKRTEIKTHNPLLLERKDLDIVNEYNDKYNDLIKTYEKFKKAGTLPKHQKELQMMAIKVKDLGKELEKSVGEAERLKELADNSAYHNGKKMGGIKQVSAEETRNLEATMKSYLKTLGLGNVEHLKFDRTSQTLTGTLRKNNKAVETLKVKYNDATKAIYAFAAGEKESLTGVPAFLNGFKKKFNSIMQYLTMTMSIHRVFAELRRGIQYLKEIDLALTELRKVTDETEETYDRFLKIAAKTGDRLGATISAVTEATATFAKLGYSMEMATEMAEAAIVYKNVGDNIASTEDAANSIISTMKGFRLEASESMAIVDRFNEVGKQDCPGYIVIYGRVVA